MRSGFLAQENCRKSFSLNISEIDYLSQVSNPKFVSELPGPEKGQISSFKKAKFSNAEKAK
jgi:hypothetical protein